MNPVPSFSSAHPSIADIPQETNLLEFAQSICCLFSRRMSEQGVTCSFDIDRTARFQLARATTGEALVRLVEDALRAMPDGGQLEIVAVIGPNGLELEVADSGETSEFTLRIHDGESRPQDPRNTKYLAGNMRVQTHRCPQGGTARTLLVPRSIKRAAA